MQQESRGDPARHREPAFFSNFRETAFISKDATKQQIEEAVARVTKNERIYKALKKEKVDEIVALLDLFGGELTLNDILTTDISFLNQLRDSKLAIIERRDKAQAARNGRSALTSRNIMSAEEFAERAKRQGQKDI